VISVLRPEAKLFGLRCLTIIGTEGGVAAELQRQHGIAFDIIPEGGWTRLYVKGLSPEQAVSADEIRKYYAREPGE
jgi:hypothetical protein